MSETQHRRSEILVWAWNLDAGSGLGTADEALLSEDERARCRRLATPQLRHRFTTGRAHLRLLLGEHLGLDPRTLVFEQNAFGKPRLAHHPSLHFSLSHSADRAVLAVSEQLEPGVDIERVRPLDHLDLARRYFHPNESAAIAGLSQRDDQLQAFFSTWTLKEAIVKALGIGLSIELDTFEVSIATSPPTLVIAPESAPRAWWLHLATGDYCRALAAPAGGDVGLIQRTV
jgi:4'-phosphopantetheinyl transferase